MKIEASKLFAQKDYISAIELMLDSHQIESRGRKSRLAEIAGCHPAYISKVFSRQADLSIEQLFAICEFFQLSLSQSEFLMNLLMIERAGTKELQNHYQARVSQIAVQQLTVKNQVNPTTEEAMSARQKSIYYSSWHYSAIHMCTLIDELRSPEKISSRLKIPVSRVELCLRSLVEFGLVEKLDDLYRCTDKHLHISSDDVHCLHNHVNWRLKVAEETALKSDSDLQYTSIVALNQQQAEKISVELLESLRRVREITRDSDVCEELRVFSFDFIKI